MKKLDFRSRWHLDYGRCTPWKWKVGNLAKNFYGRFHMTKVQWTPPPTQGNEKLEIWQKIFLADFTWPKFDVIPRNEKLEIWQKIFMAHFAWPKFDVPPPHRNKKLEIWWKIFMADLAWPKFDVHPLQKASLLINWDSTEKLEFSSVLIRA